MDENGGASGIGQGAGEVGCGNVGIIPAESHLSGDGNVQGIHHAAHEGLGLGQLGHHRGSAAGLHHLAHGATHVDVDGGNAKGLEVEGGIAHFFRHRAEELHREWAIGVVALDKLKCLGIAFNERAGVDQIRGAQIDPTDFSDD